MKPRAHHVCRKLILRSIVVALPCHVERVTRERWMREGVLSTTYSMDLIGDKGQAGRTLFRLHNPSTLVVRAKVKCNFRIYDQPTTAGGAYDGTDTWLVFPQQII